MYCNKNFAHVATFCQPVLCILNNIYGFILQVFYLLLCNWKPLPPKMFLYIIQETNCKAVS